MIQFDILFRKRMSISDIKLLFALQLALSTMHERFLVRSPFLISWTPIIIIYTALSTYRHTLLESKEVIHYEVYVTVMFLIIYYMHVCFLVLTCT